MTVSFTPFERFACAVLAGLIVVGIVALLTSCAPVRIRPIPVTRVELVRVVNAAGIPADEFARAVAAVQLQVRRDLAPAWGVDAVLGDRGTLTLTVMPGPGGVGLLGLAGHGRAEVYVGRCERGGVPWSYVLSHEVLGLLAGQQSDGRDICDVARDRRYWYSVDGVLVAGFALPDGRIFSGR